jgi:hypothetical protein
MYVFEASVPMISRLGSGGAASTHAGRLHCRAVKKRLRSLRSQQSERAGVSKASALECSYD